MSGSHWVCPSLKTKEYSLHVRDRRPLVVALRGTLADGLDWTLEAGRSLQLQLVGHGVDLKAIQPWHKLVGRSLGSVLGMDHEQHVRKPGAEVGPVRVVVPGRLGGVNVHAFGAVELHHGLARDVRQADGKHWLVLAVNSGAVAEVSLLILFQHLSDSSVCEDVSRVDQSVQHLCCLFDQIALVRIILQLLVWFKVQDHVQSLSIVRDLFIETCQVELVLDVVFVHLTEKLISSESTKPRDPRHLF